MRVPKALLATLLISSLLLAGCSLADEPIPAGPIQVGLMPGEALPSPISRPVMAEGQVLFEERCAECHGLDGAGGTGPMAEVLAQQNASLPDFSDPTAAQDRSPQEWYGIITSGTVNQGGLMPPWEGALTEAQRWSLAYYLYTLSVTPEELARGQQVYLDSLAACIADADLASAAYSPQDLRQNYLADPALCAGLEGLSPEDTWAASVYAVISLADAETTVADVQASVEQPSLIPTPEILVEEAAPAIVNEDPTKAIVAGVVTLPDGSPAAGLTVALSGLALVDSGTVETIYEESATTAADGTYRFEDLPLESDHMAYLVEVNHEGIPFSNGQLMQPGVNVAELPVTIYGRSSDPSAIRVSAMHLIIEEDEAGMAVLQFYQFVNESDGAYLTDLQFGEDLFGSVAVSVPEDATGLQFDSGAIGGRFWPEGEFIYDTQYILPGEQHIVMYQYLLPEQGRKDFALPILYPTDRINVLTSIAMPVNSDQLEEGDELQMGDVIYASYTANNLESGDTLSLSVRPAPPITLTGLLYILGAIIGVALVALGAWRLAMQTRESAAPRVRGKGWTPTQRELIGRIAELDRSFEAGEINRVDYEARRSALRLSLIDES